MNINYMDDKLNSDLVKIEEWGRVNRVEFNARKTDFVDLLQSRALKLIGDDRVASSTTSLGHRRNVSCIVLFSKYYFGPDSLN